MELGKLEEEIERLTKWREEIADYLYHLPRNAGYDWATRLKFRQLHALDEQIINLEWYRAFHKVTHEPAKPDTTA